MNRTDFLQRLIGIAGFGSFNLQAIIPKRKIYLQQFFVAGFRHYKGMEMLEFMQVNDLLELRREPTNEYDKSAIALHWQQEKIGYVPSDINELLARLMDANALPLLGTITHLNKKVKPWEKVAIAIFFLQDESFTIPNHAAYLQKLKKPVYTSKSKKNKPDLHIEIFDNYKGIIDLNTIKNTEIQNHFKDYDKDGKYSVLIKNKLYTNIATNDIYAYMYQVQPLHPIRADDGKPYVLFKFLDNAV